MSQPNYDLLFELVKSLTTKEKKYFRQFCGLHTYKDNPKQLKLFDLLDKAKVYNESAFKKKLKIENYAYVKHGLSEMIHSSLRSFHEKSTQNQKAWSLVYSVEIMIKKNLIHHADQVLQKAKSVAIKDGDKLLLAKINRYELWMLTVPNKIKDVRGEAKRVYSEFYNHLKSFDDESVLIYLLSSLITVVRQGYNEKNEIHNEIISEILNNKVIQNSADHLSIAGQKNRSHILGIVYNIKGEYEKAFQQMVHFQSLMLKDLSKIEENPRSYTSGLFNIIWFCLQHKKWDEVEVYLLKLKAFLSNKIALKNKQLLHFTNHLYLRCAVMYFAAKPLDDSQLNEFLELKKNVLNFEMSSLKENIHYIMFYWLAIYEFRTKHYDNCLELLSKFEVFEEDRNKFIEEQAYVNILKFLCLFETDAIEASSGVLRSIKRGKSKLYEESSFIKSTINYLTKLDKNLNAKLDFKLIETTANVGELPILEWLEGR